VPKKKGEPLQVNGALHEALYCAEYGWRAETMQYVCNIMPDDGGYGSTHALWALDIANRNGCISKADFERCARVLHRELGDAQPMNFLPRATLDADLYGERLLLSVMTGAPDPRSTTGPRGSSRFKVRTVAGGS
jgi:hypothetical protein